MVKPVSRGQRKPKVNKLITSHSQNLPNLKALASQFMDPVTNYVWLDGVDPLNKTGDPELWIREVSTMMHNHQFTTAGIDLNEEISFQVKWHKEYLKELRTIHELPEPVDAMGRHPPIHILQSGEKWWDVMATSGAAGEQSFRQIAGRLGEIRDQGDKGEFDALTRLYSMVMLQTLTSAGAARDAKRMKNLYSRCIQERARIKDEMEEKKGEKGAEDTKEPEASKKAAEPVEAKDTRTEMEKQFEKTLGMINATIKKLEGASISK